MGIEDQDDLPELSWMLKTGGKHYKNLTLEELAARVRQRPDASAQVWRIGMVQWQSPWAIEEIIALDIGPAPVFEGEELWYYSAGKQNEKNLSSDQVAERVTRQPQAKHRVWQLGMERWVDPYEVEALAPLLPAREEEKVQRLLMHSRNETGSVYRSAEEIVAQIEKYPNDRHKVWPQMEERWFDPWDVEELVALGVTEPDWGANEQWHFRQGSRHRKNQSASEIAIAMMQRPGETCLVWQGGWVRWEDPRDIPAIAALLPPEHS